MQRSRSDRDEAIRRLVLSRPIPEPLIRALADAGEKRYPGRRHTGRGRRMTPALWETLKLVAAGYTTPRIAEAMGVSRWTAQDRVKRLLAYFDARDRMEIVTRCYREGIL